MSIEAFYSTHIVMVKQYSYYENGKAVTGLSDMAYTKGNIQPWKKGETIQNTAGSGLLFTDTQVAYVKSVPEFEFTPPVGVQEVTPTFTYMWLPDEQLWYTVRQTQNWSRARRGPKHYKLFIGYITPAPGYEPPPTPDIDQASVERFLNETYELEQAAKLV